MRGRVFLIGAVWGLSACAPTHWINPNYADFGRSRFAADRGYCVAVAVNAVPTRYYTPVQPVTSYNDSVSCYENGVGGATCSSASTPYVSRADQNAANYANLAQLGQVYANNNAQDAVFNGCMASGGWVNQRDYEKTHPDFHLDPRGVGAIRNYTEDSGSRATKDLGGD